MKTMFFSLFLTTAILQVSIAQQENRQKWPLKVAILDESFSVPNFWFTEYPFNPAVMIGTEYSLKQNRKTEWYLNGNLGFYHHQYWRNAIFVTAEIGYRYNIQRFNLSAQLGLGYSHVFSTLPVYRYEDGDYRKVNDAGSPAFMPSSSLNLGYKLRKGPDSPELQLIWMFTVEDPLATIPIPHQFVGLGVKIYPFN